MEKITSKEIALVVISCTVSAVVSAYLTTIPNLVQANILLTTLGAGLLTFVLVAIMLLIFRKLF